MLCGLFIATKADAQSNAQGRNSFSFNGSFFSGIEYSDNPLLLLDNEEAQSVSARSRLSTSLLLRRQKFIGILDGSIDYSRIVNSGSALDDTDIDSDYVNVRFSAGGTFEFVDNLFYTDISASARPRPSGSTIISSSNSTTSRNQFESDIYAVSISPYIFRQFSNFSEASLRYRYSQIAVRGDDAIPAVDLRNNRITGPGSTEQTDSFVHEVSADYNSGRIFDRFKLRFFAEYQDVVEDEGGAGPDMSLEILSGSMTSEVILGRRMSFLTTVGYDEVMTNQDSGFDDDELSGINYSVGVRLRPGRRTDLSIQYGNRFSGDEIRINGSYALSNRLRVSLNAERRLSTGNLNSFGQQQFAQTQALGLARELAAIQSRSSSEFTNQVFQLNTALSEFSAQTGGIELSNSFTAAIVGRLRQTGFSSSLGYVDSERGRSATSEEEEERRTLIFNLSLDRQLSRRLRVTSKVDYIQNNTTNIFLTPRQCIAGVPGLLQVLVADPSFDLFSFCTSGIDRQIEDTSISLGLSYLVWGNIGLEGQYVHRRRDIGEEGLDEGVENFVSLGVDVPF